MNGDDYLLKAVDTVMRKSIAAKQRQANLEHLDRLRNIGLIADGPAATVDAALADEDERTLDKALAALEEIRNSSQ